jgi:hypothetical protein
MTCFPTPTTKLYISGAFSVTLLTMAYRNAGVKHFLDVNMAKPSKIENIYCKKNSNYALRIMNYELCITIMPLVLADSRKRGKLGRSALNNPHLLGYESSE